MGEPIQVNGPQGDGRRRVLLLAGGAALLILAVLVLPGLLFGDGGGPEDPTSFPVPEGAAPPEAPTDATVPETIEAFTDKNPFEPLVAVEASAAGAGDGAEVPAEGEEPIPPFPAEEDPVEDPLPDGGEQPAGDSDDPGDPDDPGADGSTTTTEPAPPPRQPDRVAMLEVFTDPGGQVVATIRVNDVVHQVAEGDEFATSYRVLSLDLDTRCGQLLFGDERFGLCEGDETLK